MTFKILTYNDFTRRQKGGPRDLCYRILFVKDQLNLFVCLFVWLFGWEDITTSGEGLQILQILTSVQSKKDV